MRKMSRSDGGAKYIKAAKTHTDKDGQPVRSHWLVLSQRVGDKVRHRTLLNLGTDYPKGIDIEITAMPTPAWELNAVQGLVEQWREAGIRCRIKVLPSTQYWEVWTKLPFGFTRWTHRPLGVMALALAYRSGVPWNESGCANDEFDALLTEAEGLLDANERREVMAKLERIMQTDGPIVQPIWRGALTAYDKQVKGFCMHPTSYIFTGQLALES